jgi:metal-responsive CopG/Arc/MetJ family transcriptional regulator
MQITVSIDDELLAKAEAPAKPSMTRAELLNECLRAFIQRQAARQLASFGGQAPEVEPAPRRREDTAS